MLDSMDILYRFIRIYTSIVTKLFMNILRKFYVDHIYRINLILFVDYNKYRYCNFVLNNKPKISDVYTECK